MHRLSFRSSLAGFVLTEDKGTRFQSDCQPTEQTVDVLIRHRRCLPIEFLISLSSRHEAGLRPSPASTEKSGKRIDSTDECRIAGLHVFLQMRLVKKRAVGNDRSGDGDENAAANVANEVDDPRNLVAGLF